MKDYGKIISKLSSTPWLITEEGLDMLLTIATARINGNPVTEEQLSEVAAGRQEREYRTYGAGNFNGVGVLPLEGPIFGKANLLTAMSGATDLQTFRRDFRKMLADDSISSIVLEMDTPGGSSDFVQETANEIFASREVKPTYAIANNMCGSAGLFLASQATKMYSTPSGDVGSLGVFRVHVDQSQKDAKDGYKFSYIKAGNYKTEGNPHEPLDNSARAHHQSAVDELYGEFVSAVAQGRGTSTEHVLEHFGQGRMLTAKNALQVGMIDDIVEMDDLVRELQSTPVGVSVQMSDGSQAMGTLTVSNAFALGIKLEHNQEEHSEPGSGSPPVPRTDEDDKSGDRNNSGSRRNTPPIVVELESEESAFTLNGNANANPSEHGEEELMNDEILKALGLSAGATDEQVLSAITSLTAKLSEKEAAEIKAQTFAEMFPLEAKELADNRASRITANAKSFVADHKFVTKGVGDNVKDTTVGMSALSMEWIESTYVAIATGDPSALDAFDSMLSIINSETGRVDYGEVGSSRRTETPTGGEPSTSDEDDDSGTDVEPDADVKIAASKLNKLALKLQAAAGGASKMSYGDALSAAASELPIAAKIYQQSFSRNSG